VPYREAIAAFHASDYALHVDGKGQSDKERWAEAAADVEDALASLIRDELEPGTGYVVMVDGHACRRMWTGLHNENQSHQEGDIADARTWLPGYGKGRNAPRRKPSAVIRMNIAADEVPQYVPVPRETDPDTEKESISRPPGGPSPRPRSTRSALPMELTGQCSRGRLHACATRPSPGPTAPVTPCLCTLRCNWTSTIPGTDDRRRPRSREKKLPTSNCAVRQPRYQQLGC
jgi:hypothetical protein